MMKKYIISLFLICLVSVLVFYHGNVFQASADIHTRHWQLDCVRDLEGKLVYPYNASIRFEPGGHFVLDDGEGAQYTGSYALEKLSTAYKLYMRTSTSAEIGVYSGAAHTLAEQMPSLIFKLGDRVWRFVAYQ